MIKDSGRRTEFKTGAVRDIQDGKGRFDLLPLNEISELYRDYKNEEDIAEIYNCINLYMREGDYRRLSGALRTFIAWKYEGCTEKAITEVAIHFEQGAKKYGERNWEKGIPVSRYIDSALRHLNKHLDGMTDEPHDRAFIWNILCAMWTHNNKSELIDLPFKAI